MALKQSTSKHAGERPGFVISLPSPPLTSERLLTFTLTEPRNNSVTAFPDLGWGGKKKQTKKEKRKEREIQEAGDPRSGVTGFQAAICICRDLPEHGSCT